VLTVARDEKLADLDAGSRLNNNSGASYQNAKLQLVAGEIHQVAPVAAPPMARMQMQKMAVAKAADQFTRGRNLRISPLFHSAAARRSRTTIETDSAC